MRNATVCGAIRASHLKCRSQILGPGLLVFFALLLAACAISVSAQDAKPASAPAAVPVPPPDAPSAGKALIYIYRSGRFVGSASHDHLFANDVYWAYLKSSEYAWMEVAPGTVVVKGTPEMYYAGGVVMSGFAGIHNAATNAKERLRLDVEAGKTYYMKWTSGSMGTGIKVTLMDAAAGAKEMKGLHLSPPVEQPEAKEGEQAGDKQGQQQPDSQKKEEKK